VVVLGEKPADSEGETAQDVLKLTSALSMALPDQEPDVRRVDRRLTTAVLAAAIVLLPAAAGAQVSAPAVTPPPTVFRTIALGMTIDQVKESLRKDALYQYRGDPDVSFLPLSGESLIECEGSSYLSRAYFQFADGKLYVLILVLDQKKLDHYSMFTALTGKYGEPASFNPTEAVWQSEAVRFSLERPLTVKYIDRRVFEDQVARGAAQQDLEQLSRERFIEQF
jgi:hypothetical protein